jgi:hypothetical protein
LQATIAGFNWLQDVSNAHHHIGTSFKGCSMAAASSLHHQACCRLDVLQRLACAGSAMGRFTSTGWLCRALEEHGVVSYGEVTRHTLGRSGQRLVDTLLIVSQTGSAWHPSLQKHLPAAGSARFVVAGWCCPSDLKTDL